MASLIGIFPDGLNRALNMFTWMARKQTRQLWQSSSATSMVPDVGFLILFGPEEKRRFLFPINIFVCPTFRSTRTTCGSRLAWSLDYTPNQFFTLEIIAEQALAASDFI